MTLKRHMFSKTISGNIPWIWFVKMLLFSFFQRCKHFNFLMIESFVFLILWLLNKHTAKILNGAWDLNINCFWFFSIFSSGFALEPYLFWTWSWVIMLKRQGMLGYLWGAVGEIPPTRCLIMKIEKHEHGGSYKVRVVSEICSSLPAEKI